MDETIHDPGVSPDQTPPVFQAEETWMPQFGVVNHRGDQALNYSDATLREVAQLLKQAADHHAAYLHFLNAANNALSLLQNVRTSLKGVEEYAAAVAALGGGTAPVSK